MKKILFFILGLLQSYSAFAAVNFSNLTTNQFSYNPTNPTIVTITNVTGVDGAGGSATGAIMSDKGIGTNTTIKTGTNIGPTILYGSANLTNAILVSPLGLTISNANFKTLFDPFGNIITTNSIASAIRYDAQNLSSSGREGIILRADVSQLLFDVYGSAANLSVFGLTGSAVDIRAITTNGLAIRTTGLSPIVIAANNIEALRIATNQYVGIGVIAPEAALHVKSSANPAVIFEGDAAITRFRNRTLPQYRGDVQMNSGALYINAYDDTNLVYMPIGFGFGSNVTFRQSSVDVSNAIFTIFPYSVQVLGDLNVRTNMGMGGRFTNESLNASKLMLTDAAKVSDSSAFGESDLVAMKADTNYIANLLGRGTNTYINVLTNDGTFTFQSTTGATMGVIYQGTNRFIHNYKTNTADGFNTYVGNKAGNFTNGPAGGASTLGSYNSAFGDQSLSSLTTAYDDSAFGFKTLFSTTTGYGNSAFGYEALRDNTTGYENSGGGTLALIANTSGHGNSAWGASALNANTSGNNNTAFGSFALVTATTASDNTAGGNNALRLNVSGTRNTAFGVNSAQATTVSDNTAGGYNALFANNNGLSNTAWGVSSLQANTSGSNNNANGANSQFSTTTGSQNTSAGADAGRYLTTGSGNVFVGFASGYEDGNNTGAVQRVTADYDGVYIGRGATKNSLTNLTNVVAIGTSAKVTANNQVVVGGPSIQTTILAGDVQLQLSKSLVIPAGANSRAGNTTLVGGTITVNNTTVTANTIVMLTRKTSGGTLGTAITYTVSAGTSFTITSDSALDTSVFSYLLIESP